MTSHRSQKFQQEEPRDHAAPWGVGILVAVAIAWLYVVLYAGFTLPLPNHAQFTRLNLIFLFGKISAFFAEEPGLLTGWQNLPERFDLIAVACVLAIGAWVWGRLIRRVLAIECVDRLEELAVAYGLGLSFWSLLTLGLGLLGWLDPLLLAALLVLPILGEIVFLIRGKRSAEQHEATTVERPSRWLRNVILLMTIWFIGRALFGAMLPPIAFDVREYHLGGPKEWFLDGHIHFLPHNVYTSFPFLTEMLSLSGMVLRGDWFRGALAGKLFLASFFPLTTLAIYVTGRRLFGATSGLLAMLVYVTTPWSYRIATVAYTEGGLTCYIILALLASVRVLSNDCRQPGRWILIAGLFAGSAMASKYPGVVQSVIPIGLAIVVGWAGIRRSLGQAPACPPADGEALASTGIFVPPDVKIIRKRRQAGACPPVIRNINLWQGIQAGLLYSLGVLLTVSPWLIKNWIETGNPVYPLLWSWFGGVDWSAQLNAKWHHAHHVSDYSLQSIFLGLKRITVTNDWQSVLVFAMAPFAVLSRHRRRAGWIALYLIWLLATWWGLTHRIDRFWVPLLPVACLLSGAGLAWPIGRSLPLGREGTELVQLAWRWGAGGIAALVVLFNGMLITTALIGNPYLLTPLAEARQAAPSRMVFLLNERLPPEAKVLLVGEAKIFDAQFPAVYNTVFDKSIFQQWFEGDEPGTLASNKTIRDTLRKHGITHLFVNWGEVLRYRATYGFTKFVDPAIFEELRRRGILGDPVPIRIVPLEGLPENRRRIAVEDFSLLIQGPPRRRAIVTGQLFAVQY